MSNLSVFNNDGLEILIDTETGESFCSVSGYARMSGKDKSTISRRLGAVARTQSKTAEIQTVKGLKSVALIDCSTVCEWLVQDYPEKGRQLISHLHNGGTILDFDFNEKPPTTPKKAINKEKDVVKALLTGRENLVETEVVTPLGNVDILTNTYLIEVKHWRSAKSALGQLLAYHLYYQDRKMLAVLFGKGLRGRDCKTLRSMFLHYSIEMHCVYDIPTYIQFGVQYLP